MPSTELAPCHFSHLKHMSESPAHYLASLDEKYDKPVYLMGRLIHYLTLGYAEGRAPFVVWEEGDRRGKLWEAFKAENADREIYKRSEVDEAELVASAVRSDPRAAELLIGTKERKIDWMNNGRTCRSHLDVHRFDKKKRRLVDLKTTTCANPERFPWEAVRYGYHAQMAWYQDAAAYAREPVDEVFIIAVEKKAPFAVTCFQLTPELLLEGRKLCQLWLERLLACEAANAWPSYTQTIVPLDVRREEGITLLIDGDEVAA